MKKTVTIILLLISLHHVEAQKKKILIVSTNRDSVGNKASGTFLKEMAYPFQYFLSKGYEVDIVTPKGGRASIYHWGETPAELEAIWRSEAFNAKISQTLSPMQVDVKSYGAVFYPGGHGQYFDVVDDERIAQLTTAIYERGGVIGTAGHGAASLINIRSSNGNYLVTGKRMTCFPHWAELKWMNISEYGKLLAFDMEEVLRRRGAKLTVSGLDTRSNSELTLVTDEQNRFVTGSFASSARWVAEQMVALIEAKATH